MDDDEAAKRRAQVHVGVAYNISRATQIGIADAWKEWTQRSFVLRAPNEGQFTLCVRLAPAEVYRVMPPVHHAGGARTIDPMPVTGPSPAHAMLFS